MQSRRQSISRAPVVVLITTTSTSRFAPWLYAPQGSAGPTTSTTPNPYCFGSQGTTSGPVSLLNNLLAKSDFLTGAFPAEYVVPSAPYSSCACAKATTEKRDFLGQLGFHGVEQLIAEVRFCRTFLLLGIFRPAEPAMPSPIG